MMRPVIFLSALLLLGGCSSIKPAEMRLPAGIAQNTIMAPISGIGGARHGRFTAGAYCGRFARSAQRVAIFDALVKNYGTSEFSIEGPEISDIIDARCRMGERLIDLGVLEFKPKSMAYRCEFLAGGQAFPARFELQEVHRRIGEALSRNERRGEIALGGETVQMRSVHKLEGTPIATANPIGYIFEQSGRPVGAVELNGRPRLFIPQGTDPGLARTLTIAAVTLSLFWDPANSALGD